MKYQIISFYKFAPLGNLESIKRLLLSAMKERSVYGTIIIAKEGYNSTVCGYPGDIESFVAAAQEILGTEFEFKTSYFEKNAFQRQKVKIKKEIVTLRKYVNLEKGSGTHVDPGSWNDLLDDPEVVILDTRNDYEFKVGTFDGALNPSTSSFTELPDYVEKNLSPEIHKKIAMFCTGGIRCEKFAPYMKQKGFEEVYQLEGGILRYLEEVPEDESRWKGECFVFDERISVDTNISKGNARDLSSETKRKDR